MKIKLFFAAAAILCTGTLSGFAEEQYSFSFYNSADDAGTSFTFAGLSEGGCAEIGYMKSEWSEQDPFIEVLENFTSILTDTYQTQFESANNFTQVYNYTPPEGTDISGKIVYAFIGNGATRATSSAGALFAFKNTALELVSFSAFDLASEGYIDSIALGDATILADGELPTVEILFGTVDSVTVTLAAIPEPSMFGLLAGLGALALVGARRRRK